MIYVLEYQFTVGGYISLNLLIKIIKAHFLTKKYISLLGTLLVVMRFTNITKW
jgi:hypothetical protein